MLHLESWQNRQEDSGALIRLACVGLLIFVLGCSDHSYESPRQLTLDAFKDMKVEEYTLNSQSFKENLEYFCEHSKGSRFVKKHLLDYYAHGGSAVWVDKWGAGSKTDSLLVFLERKLPEIGFSTNQFHLLEIRNDLELIRSLRFDAENPISRVMARLEFRLSSAFLTYAVGQRFGFVSPGNVLNRYDAIATDSTGKALSYHHLYDVDVEKPSDEFILSAFRHVTADSLAPYLSHLEPTSALYCTLAEKLQRAAGEERQRILVNMERCRWRDKVSLKAGDKYVIVNVPAFHLWGVSPDTVIDMRAACGALKTKTPLLSSHINYMQVNPEWVIPMSIVRTDVARHAGNPSYFSRHRYYIAERKTGKDISPSAVTSDMLLSGQYKVAQKGGPGNSLGRIIFRFPNNFSVFLHDTSSPGVFQRDNRGVSHGCVRVQRPFDLAVFLMEKDPDEWLLDKLRISMGMPPETDQGRDYMDELDPAMEIPQLVRSLQVSPRVPIIITYYTLFLTPDGTLQHYPDVYGYDKAITEALNSRIL